MTNPPISTPEPSVIERLLTSLAGIISARTVTGISGRLEEIHILATGELHPKQVVRNVESALSAGLGLEIDRRIISVAQLQAMGEGAETDPVDLGNSAAADLVFRTGSGPAESGPADNIGSGDRLIFVDHEVSIDSNRRVVCTVSLQSGEILSTGRGEGFDSPQGRAEAAARAAIAALDEQNGPDQIGLEGVAIVETDGDGYVLVSARPLRDRRGVTLTGVASLGESLEEATVLAVLQATNHWRPGE